MPLSFLFTDIEDSTAKWEADHRAMSRALLQHDRVLNEAVQAAGGRIVKHTGDGIFAVLSSEDSLRCALDIQKRVGACHWEPFAGFRVRIGLHAGEAEERNGDFFGPVINCAARVMSKAGGGQVLATQEAVQEGALPEQATAADVGVFRLKGIEKPHRLFQLHHPQMEQRVFQQIKNDDVTLSGLPTATEQMQGRQNELKEALALFESGRLGLLTITGQAGVGKTRFALALGERLSSHYPDGTCFIDLSTVDGRDTLGKSVAQALGLNLPHTEETDLVVYQYLAERQLLLILDNFEHLTTKALFVGRLLKAAPFVTVLATSRVRLNLPGEKIFNLLGLSVEPEGGALEMAVAVALASGRALNKAERATLREICVLLEGNAQAIRLAVALCAEMEPESLLNLLREILSEMGGDRSLEISAGLKGAFEAHWCTLDNDTRGVLARLSVFHAGFSTDAARAVSQATEDQLARLGRRHLLLSLEGRHHLHESVRQMALAQLQLDPAAREASWRAYRRYYMGFLREHALELQGGPRKVELLKIMDRDFANISEAWRLACEADGVAEITEGSESLCQYVDFRHIYREGTRLYGMGLQKLEAQGRSRALAEMYIRQSNCLTFLGRLEEADHLQAMALDYYQAEGNREKEAATFTLMAQVASSRGDFAAQIRNASQALDIWLQLKDAKGQAWAMTYLCQGHFRRGEYKPAKVRGEAAVKIYEAAGDISGQLWSMSILAEDIFMLGEINEARALCYKSLELARPLEELWALARTNNMLARIAELQSEYREARHYLKACKKYFMRLGLDPQMAFNLRNLSVEIQLALGDYAEAERLLSESLDTKNAPESRIDLTWPLNLLAQLRLQQGDFKGAADICDQGLKEGTMYADGGSWFKENLAIVLAALGEYPRALDLTRESLRQSIQADFPRGQAWGHIRLASVLVPLGKLEEARVALDTARKLHAQLGEPHGMASNDLLLAKIERLEGKVPSALRLAARGRDTYANLGMPRSLALAHLELGSALAAAGDKDLAAEHFSTAFKTAAKVEALPVAMAALQRLAVVKAARGEPSLAVQALFAVVEEEACDAETRETAQRELDSLTQALPKEVLEEARQKARELGWKKTGELLGVVFE